MDIKLVSASEVFFFYKVLFCLQSAAHKQLLVGYMYLISLNVSLAIQVH